MYQNRVNLFFCWHSIVILRELATTDRKYDWLETDVGSFCAFLIHSVFTYLDTTFHLNVKDTNVNKVSHVTVRETNVTVSLILCTSIRTEKCRRLFLKNKN